MPKQKSYTVAFKLSVIKWYKENGESIRKTAGEYGIDRKRIREWLKQEDELNSHSSGSNAQKRRISDGGEIISYEIEVGVLDYLLSERERGIPVNNIALKDKALEIAKELDQENPTPKLAEFKASNGWLRRWKKRNQISLLKGTNEAQQIPEDYGHLDFITAHYLYTLHNIDKNRPCVKHNAGDLIWAKLEGFPWWPSLVCDHPTEKKHFREGRKGLLIHVQFFDDPPTRSWIKEKYIKPYQGSDHKDFRRGGQFYTTKPDVVKAVQEADKARPISVTDRLQLVVAMEATTSESEEEEEEGEPPEALMDGINFDDDIFDNEMDSSKENEKIDPNVSGTNEKSQKKKSPTKSVESKRRATRAPRTKRRKIVESDGDNSDTSDEFKPESSEESSEQESSGEDEVSEGSSGADPESPVKQSGHKRKRPESKPKPPAKRTSTQESLKCFASSPSTPPSQKSLTSGNGGSFTPSVRDRTKTSPSTPHSQKLLTSGSSGGGRDSFTPTVSDRTKTKLSGFAAVELRDSSVGGGEEESKTYKHMLLDWLKPQNVRDAAGRKSDHPEYDRRTLQIPESYMKSITPAMRQWWEMKRKHFDTVLFFKVGKFYEFYHMDAVLGVNELGLVFMKGDYAHSGFPEIAYGRYAEALLQKGYKVARIEQTESVNQMEERCKTMLRATKFDKVVNREICSVQTKGTKRYSFIDGDSSDSTSSFLLAVCEKEGCETGVGSSYGVCFIDTSIGKFYVGEFTDDRHCSRLRTLVSHYPPAQVLYERGKISEKTQNILNNTLVSALKEALKSGTEFWDSGKTLKWLAESQYFIDEDERDKGNQMPESLKLFIDQGDTLGHTAAEGCDMAVSALGAVIWYLKESLMDEELLSMKSFERYTPIDSGLTASQEAMESKSKTPAFVTGRQKMVLDAVTLANLDILVNSSTGGREGTLLEVLDQCTTPFGKRLLKEWLTAPLCNPGSIRSRLDAVEDLIQTQSIVEEVRELLRKMPDLERQLNKIHALGSGRYSKDHPDSRAVFFEDATYSKRKIEDLLSTLAGFKMAQKVVKKFSSVVDGFKSSILKQTVSVAEGSSSVGKFPDLSEELNFFDNAFDPEKAKKDGTIKPSKGVNPTFDEAMSEVKDIEGRLDKYLDKQKTLLGCRSLVYWGTGRNRYQMEIPESACKNLPNDYLVYSTKKGFKRYRSKPIEDLLAELVDAEERKEAAEKDTLRRVFFNFDKSYERWELAVRCLSVIDVLICLAQFSRCGDQTMCRPEIVTPDGDTQPFLEVRNGWHPCISKTFSGGDFIPNDTVIGIRDENDMDEDAIDNATSQVVLVTGPNMGGKSTLMRQVGVIVVLAQLGCYVPAESCRLTPVDRVFTRLGASDRIMAGESTFYVELSETSAILQHASPHSLVLMDELGRGTATYDGTAIACSVVNELSQSIRCRTLFSTHYHSLVEEFSHDPNIRTGHMACMVENENEEDPSQETITFLYKFIKGECPKSYGFNAAKLADIPDEIISVAHKKAKEFEDTINKMKYFRCLCTEKDPKELRNTHKLIGTLC